LVEEGRIAVRNVRRDGIHNLQDFGKEDHVSEDIIKDNEGDIQKLTDDHINKLNELQNEKEKEILEV
jgi:ribosome recycling factor